MDFNKDNLKRQDYYVMRTKLFNTEYTPSEIGILIMSKYYDKDNLQDYWVKIYIGDFMFNNLGFEYLKICLKFATEKGFVLCDSDKNLLSIKNFFDIIEKAKEVKYE